MTLCLGGSYHVFAGRECARALALMRVDADYCDDQLEGLEDKSLKILDDWIKKFSDKYTIVGKVKRWKSLYSFKTGLLDRL